MVSVPTAAMLSPKLNAVAPAGTAGATQFAWVQELAAPYCGLCVHECQAPLPSRYQNTKRVGVLLWYQAETR